MTFLLVKKTKKERITSDLKLLEDKQIVDESRKQERSRSGILCAEKKAYGNQEWTSTFASNSVGYWYTYLQTSNFLLSILKHLTENEYTIIYSLHLAEEFCKQDFCFVWRYFRLF